MSRHLVDTAAGQVHLRTAGTGDVGVVLFHQSPSSSRMWVAVMDRLAAAGLRCAAPDMLDYGHSDEQSRQLSVDEHAALLLDAAGSVLGDTSFLIGHHTGAVFAAAASGHGDRVRGLQVLGYPLYSSWREKLVRLGGRIAPDDFDAEGIAVGELWVRLNASIEPETSASIRHTIFLDRLLAGPLWYTAYAALMAADLDEPLRRAATARVRLETVFARDDAVSRLEPGITALTEVPPRWIDGGPWVTMEHPDRVAAEILGLVERTS